MEKQTIVDNIKEWLAGLCWDWFLELSNLTEEDYFTQIGMQSNSTASDGYKDLLADKYDELLLAVEHKFEGESRHATALRYIKDAEALTKCKFSQNTCSE